VRAVTTDHFGAKRGAFGQWRTEEPSGRRLVEVQPVIEYAPEIAAQGKKKKITPIRQRGGGPALDRGEDRRVDRGRGAGVREKMFLFKKRRETSKQRGGGNCKI